MEEKKKKKAIKVTVFCVFSLFLMQKPPESKGWHWYFKRKSFSFELIIDA